MNLLPTSVQMHFQTSFVICPFVSAATSVGHSALSICRPKRSNLGPRLNARTLVMSAANRRESAAVVEIGCGTDLHGQNATTAAVRACRSK